MMSIVMLMMSLLVLEVTAYPGALCNVTYSIPVVCGEVLARITDQVGDKLLHKYNEKHTNISDEDVGQYNFLCRRL